MNKIDENVLFFIYTSILTMYFQILAYLKIENAQALGLVLVFVFSWVVELFYTLKFKENLSSFFYTSSVTKGLMLFIPFLIAMAAKSINTLYFFVDFSFSFLIIGELLISLIMIRSIKNHSKVESFDYYSIFIDKFKAILQHIAKMEKKDLEDKK